MNNILKVSKYQMRDTRKAIGIYYGVILAICALFAFLFIKAEGETSFGGFGFSTAVFMFITGLNCFKVNFKFLQANNVSRKSFYLANIITFIGLTIIMASVDLVLSNFLTRIISYSNTFTEIYKTNEIFGNFLWSSTLLLFVGTVGWFITMVYYRCDKLQKTIVSLSPVLLITLISLIDIVAKANIWIEIGILFTRLMGIANGHNFYIASLSFTVGTIITLILNYILIRRIPIRD